MIGPSGSRRLLLVLGFWTLMSSLLLLWPSPMERIDYVTRAQEIQRTNLTKKLGEMQMSKEDLDKSVAFVITRKSRDIWIRWWGVALFVAAHAIFFLLALRGTNPLFFAGVQTTSAVYILVWLASMMVFEDGQRATLLDQFVERVINEVAVDNAFVLFRFVALHVLNPIAFLALWHVAHSSVGVTRIDRASP